MGTLWQPHGNCMATMPSLTAKPVVYLSDRLCFENAQKPRGNSMETAWQLSRANGNTNPLLQRSVLYGGCIGPYKHRMAIGHSPTAKQIAYETARFWFSDTIHTKAQQKFKRTGRTKKELPRASKRFPYQYHHRHRPRLIGDSAPR